MKKISPLLSFLLCLAPLAALPASPPNSATWQFEVTINRGLTVTAQDGRLFVVLARTNNPEPRLMLGWTGLDAPQVLARDLKGFAPGAAVVAGCGRLCLPDHHSGRGACGRLFRAGACSIPTPTCA